MTAINILKKQLKKKKDKNILALLGFAYDQQAHVCSQGRPKKDYFKKAIDVFSNLQASGYQAEALRGLGTVALHQGKFSAAEKYFKASYREDKRDFKTLVALGNVARQLGQYSVALVWYKKYRDRADTNWQILVNEAFTARQAGKWTLAKRRARAALKMWPKTDNPRILAAKKLVQKITRD